MKSEPDLRCQPCRAMGVECPRGYGAHMLDCQACGYRMALVRPECVEGSPEDVACPECGLRELVIRSRPG